MEDGPGRAIAVRPVGPNDAEAVVTLAWELLRYHAEISPWLAPAPTIERFADAWQPYFERFAGVDGRLALVAELDRRLAGYLLACLRDLPPILEGPPELLVAEVMVVAEQRGRGVGRSLMGAAYEWGVRHGCQIARLHVYEPNEGAMGFYEREGFEVHERVMLKRIAGI